MTEKTCPGDPVLRAKIEQGDGFIAALDQSGGSTPGALKAFGVSEDRWSSDEEMFGLIHDMRSRIIQSPSFGGGKILGAILFATAVVGIFLNRKNIIILLMAIELMLLAVNLNFIAFSHYLGDAAGQIFVFFILTVAAAEAAIGLAILVVLFRNLDTINVEDLDSLKG